MPLRALITKGSQAYCTNAAELISDFEADHLLADRGYDTNEILRQAEAQKMDAVIPPKKNRVDQRFYDRSLYKFRHSVKNAFLDLKRWRGITTRYAKKCSIFLGFGSNSPHRHVGENLVTTVSKPNESFSVLVPN